MPCGWNFNVAVELNVLPVKDKKSTSNFGEMDTPSEAEAPLRVRSEADLDVS